MATAIRQRKAKKGEVEASPEESQAIAKVLQALEGTKKDEAAMDIVKLAMKTSVVLLGIGILLGLVLIHGAISAVLRGYIDKDSVYVLSNILPRSWRPLPPAKIPTTPEEYVSLVTNDGFYDGMSRVHNATWAICVSPLATDLLRLGMLYLAAFNLPEAQQAFQFCHQADRICPMCFWGLAMAEGPFLNAIRPLTKSGQPPSIPPNFPHFTETKRVNGYDYISKGLDILEEGRYHIKDPRTQVMTATEFRYKMPETGKRVIADEKYAAELVKLSDARPKDPDLAALAAAAKMQLVSWYYSTSNATWTGQAGSGKIGSEEDLIANWRLHARTADRLLKRAFELTPANETHVLAAHLAIHLREMTPPETVEDAYLSEAYAVGAADQLAALFREGRMPLGTGHLAHMPSHAYVRVGKWREAVDSNLAAHDLDRVTAAMGLITYLPEHTLHMLVYSASMGGDQATALRYARELPKLRKRGFSSKALAPGHESVALPLTLARFGRHTDVLKLPEPHSSLARGFTHNGGAKYARTVFHFTRALALASPTARKASQGAEGGDGSQLAVELAALREAAAAVPSDAITKPGPKPGIYSGAYKDLSAIYVQVATAKAMAYEGDVAGAIGAMEGAIALEDALPYLEPPRLFMPLRPCLARLLLGEAAAKLQAGSASSKEEAAALVGRAKALLQEDLARARGNRWAKAGLDLLASNAPLGQQFVGKVCPLMD